MDVFSAFPARPGLNGAEGPRPEARDEEGRRLGRGEREALSAAENPQGDESSPTAAAPRRIGMLVTKRPMIGRDKALAQVCTMNPDQQQDEHYEFIQVVSLFVKAGFQALQASG